MYAPSYDEYRANGGTAEVEAFTASISQAVARVDYVINPNRVLEEHSEAYKQAVCALVDEVVSPTYTSGGGGFGIGGFRMDGSRGAGKSLGELDRETVEPYLVDTGLLYMGIE